MRRARAILRFLESARLATGLLVGLAVWSILGTVIPQGSGSEAAVAAWDGSVGPLAFVVRLFGLHQAFSAPLFEAAAVLLALSTALCAWRRTKTGLTRMTALQQAARGDAASLVERHDLRIEVSGRSSVARTLDVATDVLGNLGIRMRSRDGVLSSVSSPWSVWGSPVFHWGLVAMMLAILIGVMTRSEGLMGVPVGRSLADKPDSYGVLTAGPLHVWGDPPRYINVDDFKTSFVAGGIDRGPTPIVSVRDSSGAVLKTTAVYPNNPLQLGSLTIHPSAWGFAVDASLVDTAGTEFGQVTKLVDTSEETSGGTVPLGDLTYTDSSKQPAGHVVLTVPLDRSDGHLVVPAVLQARVVVEGLDGAVLTDAVVPPGGLVRLPTGYFIRIDAVQYYARLMVVDDLTIPLLYAAMSVAMLGLLLTLVTRQQAIVVAAVSDGEGLTLYASVRIWRNGTTTIAEIRDRLNGALGAADKEGAS